MSEKWSGFTDEDIQRIKSIPSGTKSCSETVCELDGNICFIIGPINPIKFNFQLDITFLELLKLSLLFLRYIGPRLYGQNVFLSFDAL